MSECVVRMPFPDDNCHIGYDILGIGYCQIEGKRCDFIKMKERPNWCPIIAALPENHGRLVDVDQLIHETHLELVEISMNGLKGTPAYADDLRMMCKRLSDEDIAPTIVPATEGGNHEAD